MEPSADEVRRILPVFFSETCWKNMPCGRSCDLPSDEAHIIRPSIKSGTWNIPEHPGTSRNIPEHPGTCKNKNNFHEKKYNKIIIINNFCKN